MANLVVNKNILLVTCATKAITLSTEEHHTFKLLEFPVRNSKFTKNTLGGEEDSRAASDTVSVVVAGDVSVCGRLIVLCTSDKLVTLWLVSDSSVLSRRLSARVASKVRFMPSGQAIVLADKAGDAYRFSVEKPHEEGKLLLGHLSMLLDILVSPDEKYVITCDRDEKIRVSKYPNTYTIHSYCLGHEEFITGLSFLPNDNSVLISVSGDGTLRFWDYRRGSQLIVVDCSNDIYKEREVLKNSKLDDEGCTIPIKLITACKMDINSSLVCCCMSKILGCLVYRVCGVLENITTNLVQILTLPAEPWDISLNSYQLWIIEPVEKEPLCIFLWDSECCQFVFCSEPKLLSILSQINSRWDLFQGVIPTTILPQLYKRKFDNLQVYQERKKLRLSGICSSSCTNMSTH
ncbi:tRNA (guanine-N(7)-)-methyltransferase non-catalytic subunit wdr4 [Periplaneta americana]|uniref:tRNA (guanine-N(7)-)-methyltransferase non-catalytic subunit wuho n=1 Tax=Periplaneta americana TaxID=6978 RepID=A0ABQ8SRJ9_PERAM|nr:hypothetical protein ANN_18692 [Periplaneta americana]